MNSSATEQIIIGSIIALITAAINQAFAGNINYWLVLLVFFSTIMIFSVYKTGLNSSVLTKYYVKYNIHNADAKDNKSLIARVDCNPGKFVKDRWQFTTSMYDWAIYQYLRQFQGAGRDLDKLSRIRARERREIK